MEKVILIAMKLKFNLIEYSMSHLSEEEALILSQENRFLKQTILSLEMNWMNVPGKKMQRLGQRFQISKKRREITVK